MKLVKFKNEHIIMSIQALIVGLLAGFGAVGVRALIKFFQYVSYGNGTSILASVVHFGIWYRLAVPTIGGLVVGLLIYHFAREAKGHGVPEVMTACLLEGGKIRGIVAVIKALASAICIGSGGSVGREGPLVQIGASLGSTIARIFKRDDKGTRTLVACGAAGGIAAAFNAPFAGCLFAVEIILGDFGVAAFSPIVIATVAATLVSHRFVGDFPTFVIPKPAQYSLHSNMEIIPYVVMGFLCGFAALLFIRLLYYLEDKFDDWRFPDYLKPAVGGLIIGAIGLLSPHVLGVGYETMEMALTNQMPSLNFILLLIVLKIIATSITLGSGGSGGIFAPSLFIGAMTGSAIGYIFGLIFPESMIAQPGAYALVGMGAMVAGATHAPITAIIIIFELTHDYNIILPLMFTCIISSLVTSSFKKESIYTEKLFRRGIVFREGKEESILKSISIEPYIQKNYNVFKETDMIHEIIDRAITSNQRTFPITDNDNRLHGILTLQGMKKFFYDRDDLENIIIAEDIMIPPVSLKKDMNLSDAIEVFNEAQINELPVMDKNHVVGILNEQNIINIYNNEINKRHLAMSIISRKKYSTSFSTGQDIGDGFWLNEIIITRSMAGKQLKNTNLRYGYNLEVILVKKSNPSRTILPGGNYILEEDDTIVVVGLKENVDRFKNEYLTP